MAEHATATICLSILGAIAGLIGAVGGGVGAYLGWSASQSALQLQRDVHAYQVAANRYEPKYDAGTLTLLGSHSNDRPPETLFVQPIFSDGQSDVRLGDRVPVPIFIGLNPTAGDFSELRFESIYEAMCEYPKNKIFCEDETYQVDQVLVEYMIDGIIFDARAVALGS
ncbi:hypothetical protein [Sulfitobacter dubius]|uniref:hypothetical protein n=1 Tax=Sulfitobacter dubius TaxID=218673 RepID=UPI0008EF9F4B|nr:hypothetical protein [Sulfitobacter dubius]SFG69103.1 hypothetical protein SAMN04488039_1011679 [Sulfitobacter dubius]